MLSSQSLKPYGFDLSLRGREVLSGVNEERTKSEPRNEIK